MSFTPIKTIDVLQSTIDALNNGTCPEVFRQEALKRVSQEGWQNGPNTKVEVIEPSLGWLVKVVYFGYGNPLEYVVFREDDSISMYECGLMSLCKHCRLAIVQEEEGRSYQEGGCDITEFFFNCPRCGYRSGPCRGVGF